MKKGRQRVACTANLPIMKKKYAMMKKCLFLLLAVCMAFTADAQSATDTLRHEVLLNTTLGDIRMVLYNETPKHRDNFLRMVRKKLYDGVLFHRVIKDFMIQTGDLATRKPGKRLVPAPPKTQIPAEIVFPQYYHKRGAVAAAREDDNVNPKKASSSTDFYIVWGRQLHESQIDYFQHRLDTLTGGKVQLTPEIRETYNKLGGTPFLDGRYTVFGEVVEGMDVVEKIQLAETGAADKPKEEIRIIKATVVK